MTDEAVHKPKIDDSIKGKNQRGKKSGFDPVKFKGKSRDSKSSRRNDRNRCKRMAQNYRATEQNNNKK